jgi:hypothetical protein
VLPAVKTAGQHRILTARLHRAHGPLVEHVQGRSMCGLVFFSGEGLLFHTKAERTSVQAGRTSSACYPLLVSFTDCAFPHIRALSSKLSASSAALDIHAGGL